MDKELSMDEGFSAERRRRGSAKTDAVRHRESGMALFLTHTARDKEWGAIHSGSRIW